MFRKKVKNGKPCVYPILIKGIVSKQNFKYEIESLKERFQQALQQSVWINKVLYHIIVFIRECEQRKVQQVNNISIETIYVLKNSEDPNIFVAVEDQNQMDKQISLRAQFRILVRKIGIVLKKDQSNQESDYLEQLMNQVCSEIFPQQGNHQLFQKNILEQLYLVNIRPPPKYERPMSAVYIIQKPFYIQNDSEEIVVKFLETEELYHDREIKLLEKVSESKYCTKMFCYSNWKTTQFIFMKKNDITLKDLNNQIAQKCLEEQDLLHIINQFLLSLQELHSYGIIHRDLKPENIMFQMMNGEKFNKDQLEIQKLRCVLIDFDRSTIEKSAIDEENPTASKYQGTRAYQPPEGSQNLYESSYDVWQIGYIILCQLLRQPPNKKYSTFRERPINQNMYNEAFASYFQSCKQLYPNYFEIIQRMMNIEPSKRPQISEILELFLKLQK